MNEQLKKLFLHMSLASRNVKQQRLKKELPPREVMQMLLRMEEERGHYEERIEMLKRKIERFKYLSP